MTIQWSNDL